eukprot:s3080_g4.t1
MTLQDETKVTEKKQDFPKVVPPKTSQPVVKTEKVDDPMEKKEHEVNSTAETPEMEEEKHAAQSNQAVPLPAQKEAEKGLGLNLLKLVESQLNEKAANGSKEEDLRRAQLTMRASEKERVEEEREANKEKKNQEKKHAKAKKAKAKGRPRKKEGEAVSKSKKPENAEEEEEQDEAPASRRRRKGGNGKKRRHDEEDDSAAEPRAAPKSKAKAKAKAKPKAGPKRTPRPRVALPEPDEKIQKDLVNLMKRYHKVPYDKLNDTLHKVYTKKNANPYACIYWNRPAGGVKIVLEDKSEIQRFYFSSCYPTIAVQIYMCNKLCEDFASGAHGWWESPGALQLEQLLLVSAAEAEKEFMEWSKDAD